MLLCLKGGHCVLDFCQFNDGTLYHYWLSFYQPWLIGFFFFQFFYLPLFLFMIFLLQTVICYICARWTFSLSFITCLSSLKDIAQGFLGGSAVNHLPSAQGVILESPDWVPHQAPCMEPASPSACVSASLFLCILVNENTETHW